MQTHKEQTNTVATDFKLLASADCQIEHEKFWICSFQFIWIYTI